MLLGLFFEALVLEWFAWQLLGIPLGALGKPRELSWALSWGIPFRDRGSSSWELYEGALGGPWCSNGPQLVLHLAEALFGALLCAVGNSWVLLGARLGPLGALLDSLTDS